MTHKMICTNMIRYYDRSYCLINNRNTLSTINKNTLHNVNTNSDERDFYVCIIYLEHHMVKKK